MLLALAKKQSNQADGFGFEAGKVGKWDDIDVEGGREEGRGERRL